MFPLFFISATYADSLAEYRTNIYLAHMWSYSALRAL